MPVGPKERRSYSHRRDELAPDVALCYAGYLAREAGVFFESDRWDGVKEDFSRPLVAALESLGVPRGAREEFHQDLLDRLAKADQRVYGEATRPLEDARKALDDDFYRDLIGICGLIDGDYDCTVVDWTYNAMGDPRKPPKPEGRWFGRRDQLRYEDLWPVARQAAEHGPPLTPGGYRQVVLDRFEDKAGYVSHLRGINLLDKLQDEYAWAAASCLGQATLGYGREKVKQLVRGALPLVKNGRAMRGIVEGKAAEVYRAKLRQAISENREELAPRVARGLAAYLAEEFDAVFSSYSGHFEDAYGDVEGAFVNILERFGVPAAEAGQAGESLISGWLGKALTEVEVPERAPIRRMIYIQESREGDDRGEWSDAEEWVYDALENDWKVPAFPDGLSLSFCNPKKLWRVAEFMYETGKEIDPDTYRELWRRRPREEYAENLRESDALRRAAHLMGEEARKSAEEVAEEQGVTYLDAEGLAENLTRMFQYGRAMDRLIEREVEVTYDG